MPEQYSPASSVNTLPPPV